MNEFLKKAKAAIDKAAAGVGDWWNEAQARANELKANQPKPKQAEIRPATLAELLSAAQPKIEINKPKPVPMVPSESAKETAGKIVEFGKSVLRAAPRAIASVIGSATGLKEIKPEDAEYPTMAKFLLGTEPIRDVRGTGEQFAGAFGAGEETKKKFGLPIGIALTAADLWPGLGGKGKLAEQIAKEGGEDAIKKMLLKGVKDVTEEEAVTLAKKLAPVTAKKEVTAVLEDFAKTKAARVAEGAGTKVAEEVAPKVPSRISKSVHGDVLAEDFTDIKGIPREKVKKIQIFGSSVEGKAKPGDIDVFVTVSDDAAKWKKAGGLPQPITFERGKFSYVVMPESDAQELLDAMLYTGRKDLDRGYSGKALNLPKSLWAPVKAEIPKGTKAMKSIGEILNEGYVPGGGGAERAAKAVARAPKEPERQFITRAKGMVPDETKKLFEGKYEPRATQKLIDDADNLIKTNRDEAITLAKTGTDDKAVATASRLVDDAITRAKEATDDAVKNKWYEEAADVANAAAKNLTEQGRAVQAASILGRMSPEGMARYAARQIQKYNEGVLKAKGTLGGFFKGGTKIPELTAAQLKEITTDMARIEKIRDTTERAMEFQKLQKKIAAMVPSSLYDKIVTVWKAGLLTGMKTSGLNILSNVSHAFTEGAKDVPASIIDRIASIFTGKRTLAFTGKGTKEGVKEGVEKGWRYLKTGFDERDIGTKLDYKQVNFGTSKLAKAIQSYEEAVFRLLGSEDQPFYYAAKARSMYSQAIAQAKNAGLKGAEAKKFVEDLVKAPTDDMLKYATLDAETAVFQNATALGKFAKGFQKLPGGQIIAPFGKTPSAVATQLINYSPIGIVKTIAENIGKGRFDQRLFAQGLGRGLTGTGLLYLGMKLFDNDMITLDWPTSEKEQKQWELEGRLPNTIKIGGKWRNIGIFGPAGMALVVGGHVKDAIDEDGSFTAGMASILPGVFSTVSEQTFLKGVNQALDAIQDPQRSFRGFATSLAGSVVPTIVADVARATDNVEVRADYPADRLMSRIPGLRELLEPKVDVLGEEIKTPGFWTVMIDATRPGTPSQLPDDPVIKELRRLADADQLATPTQLGPKRGYESLTPAENTELWKVAGDKSRKAIEDIMANKAYDRYDDEQKAKVIGKVVDIAKDESRAEIARRILASKETREEKEQALRKMKEEGLVTQNVYARIPRSERVLKWKDLLK